jgi:hypothetical protein
MRILILSSPISGPDAEDLHSIGYRQELPAVWSASRCTSSLSRLRRQVHRVHLTAWKECIA